MEGFFSRLFGDKKKEDDGASSARKKIDVNTVYDSFTFEDFEFENNSVGENVDTLWKKFDVSGADDQKSELMLVEVLSILADHYDLPVLHFPIPTLNVTTPEYYSTPLCKWMSRYNARFGLLLATTHLNLFSQNKSETNTDISKTLNKFYTFGHPSRFVLGLRREFQSACLKIDKFFAEAFESQVDFITPDVPVASESVPGLTVASLLFLLTFYLPNRLILMRSKCHTWILKLIKVLFKRYTTLLNLSVNSTMENLKNSSFLTEMIAFVEPLLFLCLKICNNLIDPFNSWRSHTGDSLDLPVKSSSSLYDFSVSVTVQMEESGLLDTLTGLIHELSQYQKKGGAIDLPTGQLILHQAAFELIGSMCYFSTTVKHAFYHTGVVLPYIVGLVGWPSYFSLLEYVRNSDSVTELQYKLSVEFDFQLLAIQVIFQASCGQPDILQYLERIGGFDKLTEFLLWVSSYSIKSPELREFLIKYESQNLIRDEYLESSNCESKYADSFLMSIFHLQKSESKFVSLFEKLKSTSVLEIVDDKDDEDFGLQKMDNSSDADFEIYENSNMDEYSLPASNILSPKNDLANPNLYFDDWLNLLHKTYPENSEKFPINFVLPDVARIISRSSCSTFPIPILQRFSTTSYPISSSFLLELLFFVLSCACIQSTTSTSNTGKRVSKSVLGGDKSTLAFFIFESVLKIFKETTFIDSFETNTSMNTIQAPITIGSNTIPFSNTQIARLLISCDHFNIEKSLNTRISERPDLFILPTLQISVLQFFSTLVNYSSVDFVNLLRNSKFCSIIFTPYFYFLPISFPVDFSSAYKFDFAYFENVCTNIPKLAGIKPRNYFDYSVSCLRVATIQLLFRTIQNTEMTDKNSVLEFNILENVEIIECLSLIEWAVSSITRITMKLFGSEAEIVLKNRLSLELLKHVDSVLQISNLLIFLLRTDLPRFQNALLKSDFFTFICRVIAEQHSLFLFLNNNGCCDSKLFIFVSDHIFLTRSAILKLFDYCVSTKESRIMAGRVENLIEVFFSLITENDCRLKCFALRLISDLLIAAGFDDGILEFSSKTSNSFISENQFPSSNYVPLDRYLSSSSFSLQEIDLSKDTLKSFSFSPGILPDEVNSATPSRNFNRRASATSIMSLDATSGLSSSLKDVKTSPDSSNSKNVFELLESSEPSRPHYISKKHIFSKFIELMSTISTDYDLVRGLLYVVRRTLSYKEMVTPEVTINQQVFRDGGLFEQVVSILNGNLSECLARGDIVNDFETFRHRGSTAHNSEEVFHISKSSVLIIDVLSTLTSLMVGNIKAKTYFRETIGYGQIKSLILRVERQIVNYPIFISLFDMLMDGIFSNDWFSDHGTPPVIQNPETLGLILNLINFSDENLKIRVLNRLYRLIKMSILNQSYACKAYVLEDLIDLLKVSSSVTLQKGIIKLIELLGSHSLNVKQVKKFFQLMKSSGSVSSQMRLNEVPSTRPFYNPLLLQAIQNMQVKGRPSSFFYFDGTFIVAWFLYFTGDLSGLSIPTIERWPSSKGFTFSTWIRIESYEHPIKGAVPKKHYQPRLYSFLTKDNCGFEAFFNNGKLTFQVIIKPGQFFVEFVDVILRPKVKWYHLAITHSVGSTFGSSPQLKVYIDGKLRFHKGFTYPHVKKPLTQCFIGSDSSVPKPKSLFAQMSAIYIFDDVLSAEHVQGLFCVGSSYMFSFCSDLAPDMLQYINIYPFLVNGSLTSSIFLTYNAKACDASSNLFLDNTPEINRSSGNFTKNMHAIRLPGTHPCVTRDIRDTLDCLGGIKLLFPLFAQLDQNVILDDSAISQRVDSLDNANSENKLQFLVHILRVVCDMVHENVSNQIFMKNSYGFGVISHLIRQISPTHLTLEALLAFERLINAVSFDMNMYRDAFNSLFFDGELWIYTKFEIQIAWIQKISDMISSKQEVFRRDILGVQKVLDLMRSYYWFTPESNSMSNFLETHIGDENAAKISGDSIPPPSLALHQQVLHPVTREVVGERPSLIQIRRIRLLLLKLIVDMVGNTPNESELKSVLAYLTDCTDLQQKIDVMVVILCWIDASLGKYKARRSLTSPSGLEPFLNLLNTGNNVLTTLALEIIGRLLPLVVESANIKKTSNLNMKREDFGNYSSINDTLSSVSSNFTSSSDYPTSLPPVSFFSTPPCNFTQESTDTRSTKMAISLPNYIAEKLIAHPEVDAIFAVIFSALMGKELTEAVYFVLFSMAIADMGTDKFDLSFLSDFDKKSKASYFVSDEVFLRSSFGHRPNVFLDGSQRIVCPVALSVIFKLLLGSSKSLIQMAIQDMMFLIHETESGVGEDNKLIFLDLVGWQTWIFDLIFAEQSSCADPTLLYSEENVSANVILEMAFKFMSILLWAPIANRSNGWIYYQDCLGYLVLFAKGRQVSTSNILLPLIRDMINKLSNHSKVPPKSTLKDKDTDRLVIENMMGVLRITECFILARLKTFSKQSISNSIPEPPLVKNEVIVPLEVVSSETKQAENLSILTDSNFYTTDDNFNIRLYAHYRYIHDENESPNANRNFHSLISETSSIWSVLQYMLNIYDVICVINSGRPTVSDNRTSFSVKTGPHFADPTPFIVRCFMLLSFFTSPTIDVVSNNEEIGPTSLNMAGITSLIHHSFIDINLFASHVSHEYFIQLLVSDANLVFPPFLFSTTNSIPRLRSNLLSSTIELDQHDFVMPNPVSPKATSTIQRMAMATQRSYVAALLHAADTAHANTASHSLNISALLIYVYDLLLQVRSLFIDLKDCCEKLILEGSERILKLLETQSDNYLGSMNRLLRVIHHILTVNPSLVVALEVPTEASVESYKFISEFVSTVPPNFDCSSNFDWSKKWVEIIASSSLWKNIFELRLCSLWPLAERVQLSAALTMANHFDSFIDLISRRTHSFSSLQQADQRIHIKGMQSVTRDISQGELNRRVVALVGTTKVCNVFRESWVQITRSLTNERAPWYINDGHRVFWKLDPHENCLRMRCKLKINYLGTSHADAILEQNSRNSSPKSNRRKIMFESGQPNIPLAKSLAGINIFESQRLNSQVDLLVPTRTPAKPKFQLGKEGSPVPVSSNLPKEDVLVFQTDCAHVSPMQLVHGSLELYRDQLFFFAFADSNSKQEAQKVKHEIGRVSLNTKLQFVALNSVDKSGSLTASLESEQKRRNAIRDASRRLPLGVKDHKWELNSIQQLHFRRHQLARNSIEIFFDKSTAHFFTFFTERKRDEFFQVLMTLVIPQNIFLNHRSPAETLDRSGLTHDWVRRKISNFEYLMRLNTIVGRTFNDLTQYPVFPWILKDYLSPALDLKDPTIYRDLSKPIGALQADRLQMFLDRFNAFDDPEIPKFLYGSHYSNSGAVLYYLIRMEPFTSLALHLQGGKFDHADRLFDSIAATWNGVMNNATDVKELIPEMFYLPDILRNVNNLNLGVKQTKKTIDNVVLPNWAATPEDFIRIHRAALESDYVSAHLHEWIDLIFGYKQRGQASIDAHNVFFHLTYEGAVDIESITDPLMKEATISQIDNFGQTPSQLFFEPHPSRHPRQNTVELLLNIFERLDELKFYLVSNVTASGHTSVAVPSTPSINMISPTPHIKSRDQIASLDNAVILIHHYQHVSINSALTGSATDSIITVGLDRIIAQHRWKSSSPEYVPPFVFELDKSIAEYQINKDSGQSLRSKRFGVHFADNMIPQPSCFSISKNGQFIISCGHWDSSIKVSRVDNASLMQSVFQHKDIVTCVALDRYFGNIIVTGSKDTTVIIWQFDENSTQLISKAPLHILFGHDDEVSCVAVNCDLDIVVSGSVDGTCIVHTVRQGRYVRSIFPPGINSGPRSKVSSVGISSHGDIMTYSLSDLMLHLYSINGVHMASVDTHERLYAFVFSRNGEHIVMGGDRQVTIRRTFDFKIVRRLKESSRSIVRSLALTVEEANLIVGLQSGQILIYALDARILRERTLQKLTDLGF